MVFARPRHARKPIIRVPLFIASLLGLALVVYLIIDSGSEEVAHAMLLIGWWLIPISLFHLVPLVLSALSWRELLPRSNRLGVVGATWNRWIQESINSLLPVAAVGGNLASARLAHRRGVPGAQAAAGMIVDTTVGVVTQLLFVMTGLLLLVIRSTERATLHVAWMVSIGTCLFFAAIAAFVFIQHRGMFGVSAKLAHRFLPDHRRSDIADSASMIDRAVVAIYRNWPSLCGAGLLRVAGWTIGAGEIWLVLQLLGQPLGVIDALILESLGAGVRAAAFMVPGALGILEGSSIAFGALFGLPAEAALAITLDRRVRELSLGLPGLLVWQWLEGHHLVHRIEFK